MKARKIQTRWRSFIGRKNYVKYQATTSIQSIVRMYLFMSNFVAFMKARKIQTRWRSFIGRKNYVKYQATTSIQSIVRMYLCRSNFVAFMEARKIQTRWRSFIGRKKYVAFISARKIQSRWRAYTCRKKYIEFSAAVMIQTKWRSHDCSSQYNQYCSARRIQKTWRSYHCKMNYLHMLANIIIMQSIFRRFLIQKQVEGMKNRAVTAIQRFCRGYVCFTFYKKYMATRKIQSVWRGHTCFSFYKKYIASRKIQSAWRRYVKYTYFTTYIKATNKYRPIVISPIVDLDDEESQISSVNAADTEIPLSRDDRTGKKKKAWTKFLKRGKGIDKKKKPWASALTRLRKTAPPTDSEHPRRPSLSSSSISSITVPEENDKKNGEDGKEVSNLLPLTVIDPETASSSPSQLLSPSSSSSVSTLEDELNPEVPSKQERRAFMDTLLDREYFVQSL